MIHAHMGQTNEEWQKNSPHWPQDKKDGGA